MLLKTCESKTISENLTTSLSEHLPQFLIIGKLFDNVKGNVGLPILKKKSKHFMKQLL